MLPLSKKETLHADSRTRSSTRSRPVWQADYDETQNIGKRYRRQDELGTPYCVTVDFDSLDDRAVTVRDRDTMAQDRVSLDRLIDYLTERLDP